MKLAEIYGEFRNGWKGAILSHLRSPRISREALALVAATFLSVAVGLIVLASEIEKNSEMLQLLVRDVASLVETQDRPELQRLLLSAGENGGHLYVIEDGLVFSSSGSLAELDRPYHKPTSLRLNSRVSISLHSVEIRTPIFRENGSPISNAEIVMVTPLLSLVVYSVGVALFVLLIGLLIGRKWGRAVTEKRIKELSAASYKRIIHDLHSPIAALRTSVRLSTSPSLSEAQRLEASENVPEIAEQILSQITSAKTNLEFETNSLKEEDLRQCVNEATYQAQLASDRLVTIDLQTTLPDRPVILPHDRMLLRRAVSNIVKNALDACKSTVRVSMTAENAKVAIRVQDDGPGLSEENATLYLLGRGQSTKGDRQAYGLATANHITRAHGGHIVFHRSELGGCSFEIHISG